MKLLRRSEIIDLIKKEKVITDYNYKEEASKLYNQSSPLQPCSLDLHVGEIYIPGKRNSQEGGKINPIKSEHIAKTGNTVLIRTEEKICLPNDIAGICFSPSRIALKGIMITNMGHIDPGYEGHLHFTLINMSKSDFSIRNGDVICTMLLIQLSGKTDSYGAEQFIDLDFNNRTQKIPCVIENSYPKLAHDFMDFNMRAKSIARETITKAQIIGPIIVALIIGLSPVIIYFVSKPWEKEMKSIEKRMSSLEMKNSLEERIKKLENINNINNKR